LRLTTHPSRLNGIGEDFLLNAFFANSNIPTNLERASLAYCTKCLSGSFNAGVKIEIITVGSLPVFVIPWTLPIGLK